MTLEQYGLMIIAFGFGLVLGKLWGLITAQNIAHKLVEKAIKKREKVVAEKAKRRPSGVEHRPWKGWEIRSVLAHMISDKRLGQIIGRSVQAIQQKRYLLKSIKRKRS